MKEDGNFGMSLEEGGGEGSVRKMAKDVGRQG